MIKYAEIDGYKNLGEIEMLSHLYQFIEKDKPEPMVILIHAYESETRIFKGYLYNSTKTYRSVPLEDTEKAIIEIYTGKAEQVDFDKFIVGTILEAGYIGFSKEGE